MMTRFNLSLGLALLAWPAAALTVGETAEGTLNADDGTAPRGQHMESHTLALTEGQTLAVTLRSNDFDPYLVIELPDGQTLTDDDSAGNFDAQVIIANAPAGEATVNVTSYAPGETGAFSLMAAAMESDGELALGADAPATGTFTLGGDQAVIALSAPAGVDVTIDVASTAFDTVLTAIGAAGPITNDDAEGTNSRVRTEVPASGQVLLVVTAFSEGQGEFTVQAAEAPPSMAPPFTLPNLDGEQVASSQFDDKIRIIDFWATWCGPCRREIPHFIEIAKEYPDDVAVIGISNEDSGTVRGYAEENGVNYTMLIDGDRQAMAEYGAMTPEGQIRGIPTTFVVDRDGSIANIFIGYRDKQVFVDEIERLMGSN